MEVAKLSLFCFLRLVVGFCAFFILFHKPKEKKTKNKTRAGSHKANYDQNRQDKRPLDTKEIGSVFFGKKKKLLQVGWRRKGKNSDVMEVVPIPFSIFYSEPSDAKKKKEFINVFFIFFLCKNFLFFPSFLISLQPHPPPPLSTPTPPP